MSVQGRGRVFLMAATLRPETMFGQTNCWVLPDGQYGAYRAAEADAVFVMSARAARNLGFQDALARPSGERERLAVCSGRDLLGTPLKVRAAGFTSCYHSCGALTVCFVTLW